MRSPRGFAWSNRGFIEAAETFESDRRVPTYRLPSQFARFGRNRKVLGMFARPILALIVVRKSLDFVVEALNEIVDPYLVRRFESVI
jgi:hypothetical protein